MGGAFLLNYSARVPSTLARSYLVKKFDVIFSGFFLYPRLFLKPSPF